MQRFFSLTLVLLFNVNLLASSAYSQGNQSELSLAGESNAQAIEDGRFRLFIWKLPVGEEGYTIERNGEAIIVRSNFEYSYTQKKVSLTAILQTRRDLQPEKSEMQGNTYREPR